MQLLEFGKDNYWTGDKMVDHTLQIAILIFQVCLSRLRSLVRFR